MSKTTIYGIHPDKLRQRLAAYNLLIKEGFAYADLYNFRQQDLRKHLKKLCKNKMLKYSIDRGTITYTVVDKDTLHKYLEKNQMVRDSYVGKILHLLKPTQ